MTSVSAGSWAATAADSPCGSARTTTSYPLRLAASLGATIRSAYGSRWGCSSPRRRPALELACTPASPRFGCPASSRHTSPPAYPVAPVTPTAHVCPSLMMHDHTARCMAVHTPRDPLPTVTVLQDPLSPSAALTRCCCSCCVFEVGCLVRRRLNCCARVRDNGRNRTARMLGRRALTQVVTDPRVHRSDRQCTSRASSGAAKPPFVHIARLRAPPRRRPHGQGLGGLRSPPGSGGSRGRGQGRERGSPWP